ncbi:MAG: hypothetical protein FJ125_09215 [Deltaproteobacteria bacterium]|nr:hypothetical protein [Deltaproteobacteria bacterium]
MRTAIDLPAELLDSVQEATGAPTRRQALVVALEDYLRRKRIEGVIEAAGTLEFDLEARQIRDLDAFRRERA